jgi:hypothetical protein
MILRTNFASRPFYNERAVQTILVALAVLAVLISALNIAGLLALTRRNAGAVEQAERAEAQVRELSQRARDLQRGIDPQALDTLTKAAREANRILDRRTFSWTELFNYLEETLPPDVRLVAVEPQVSDRGVTVSLLVVGRRVADVDAFMENLERSGAFADVAPGDEQVTESNEHQVMVIGRYRNTARPSVEQGP